MPSPKRFEALRQGNRKDEQAEAEDEQEAAVAWAEEEEVSAMASTQPRGTRRISWSIAPHGATGQEEEAVDVNRMARAYSAYQRGELDSPQAGSREQE